MATFELQSVTRPSIEFECGGQRVTSTIMTNMRNNPNFEDPHLLFDVVNKYVICVLIHSNSAKCAKRIFDISRIRCFSFSQLVQIWIKLMC